jgi:drug/metabolite transporter (DMT)-like permease
MILQRAVCGIAGFCFIFLAVQKTSLVNTMLLNNAAPLWIPFVILIWRKTPINHALWPGVLAGFVGVICILRPGSGLFNIGALYALAAGILLSINMVTQRVLSYTERNHTVLFYYFLINILICLPWSLSEWVAPTSEGWIELLGIGVLTALGQWANFRAFHFGKASQLGPFVYSAVIYAILLDWAIYGQVPHWLSWLGIALVCAGGVWTIRASRATN